MYLYNNYERNWNIHSLNRKLQAVHRFDYNIKKKNIKM